MWNLLWTHKVVVSIYNPRSYFPVGSLGSAQHAVCTEIVSYLTPSLGINCTTAYNILFFDNCESR